MADTQTTVVNLDIQLLDADRSNTTTIKLDNPKNDVTREQVSAAMQPAFTNGWFLSSKGDPLMYIGDVTINQSIKTKLDGQDFYVTPSELTLTYDSASDKSAGGVITVSGATIQGTNFVKSDYQARKSISVADNGLSVTVVVSNSSDTTQRPPAGTFTLILIIMGQSVYVPIIVPQP